MLTAVLLSRRGDAGRGRVHEGAGGGEGRSGHGGQAELHRPSAEPPRQGHQGDTGTDTDTYRNTHATTLHTATHYNPI